MKPRIHNRSALSPRPRARRALTALAGLSALALSLPALAAPSSKVGVFLDNGEGQPGLKLSEHVVVTGRSHGLGMDALGPDVTQTPLQHVIVTLESDRTTVEADLFDLDPNFHAFLMQEQMFFGVVFDPFGYAWQDLTMRPADSTKVSLPFGVVLPYPNSDFLFLPPPGSPPIPVDVRLDVTKFVGGAPQALAGAAADPSKGSLKGIRVYDHGFCSHGEYLEPLYNTIQEKIWKAFVGKAQDASSDAERFYTAMVTELRHNDKDPTHDLVDGFQLAAHLNLITPQPAPNVGAHGFAETELILNHGHLRARYSLNPVIVPETKWPVSDQDVIDQVLPIFDSVLDGIGEEADKAQTIDVLGNHPDAKACDPQVVDPCHDARLAFAGDVKLASALVQFQYGLSQDPDYSFNLSKAVMDEELWSCVMTQPADPPNHDDCNPDIDPQCIHDKPNTKPDPDLPPPDKAKYECRFFVPASRLNVYPDELELVWFDSLEESTNPAVGVFAAAHASGNQAAEEALCSPRPDPTQAEFRQRMYAKSFMGYDLVQAP